MIKIAICDDDSVSLERIGRLIAQQPELPHSEAKTFLSGESLLSTITEDGWQPDIAVLDIVFGSGSGIDGIGLAKELNLICPSCSIIFLTSHLCFAPDVYETRHSYFVLKSQVEAKIGAALKKAQSEIDRREFICLHCNAKDLLLPVNEVLFIERKLKKTLLVQATGEEYWVSAKPSELLCDLQESSIVHCHQSFWVNLEFVSRMSSESFLLTSGHEIPISRGFRSEAKAAFHSFLCRASLSRVM